MQAIHFFSNLSQKDVHFAAPMSRALVAIGDHEQAFTAMHRALQVCSLRLDRPWGHAHVYSKSDTDPNPEPLLGAT